LVTIRKLLPPIIFFICIVLLWQIIPNVFSIPKYIFPKLSEIITEIFLVSGNLKDHLFTTLTEAILGFIIGSSIGFLVGVLMAESKVFSRILLPYVIGSNAIPIVAIAPIVILWFGHGIESKIVLSAFLCFFPLSINTFRGLGEYDITYRELFSIYGGNKFEFLTKYKLFNAIPFIFSGLKLNATYSVIGAIVAEFVGATSGLGFGMLQASYNLNTPRLYGYIIVSCILGMLMYALMFLLELLVTRKLNLPRSM